MRTNEHISHPNMCNTANRKVKKGTLYHIVNHWNSRDTFPFPDIFVVPLLRYILKVYGIFKNIIAVCRRLYLNSSIFKEPS